MPDADDAVDCIHHRHLRRAALLALRGHGGAEPNPMVGCIIVNALTPNPSPKGRGEFTTVGWGYHRQIGGPHAEIVALQRAGGKARGATMYCTLEPCNHQGRTGPCTQAIIEAGITRVIVARRDPWRVAAGGLERLREAGIDARVMEIGHEIEIGRGGEGERGSLGESAAPHFPISPSPHLPISPSPSLPLSVSEPFVHRLATGLPWVTVKWAQTLDGYIALPSEGGACDRRWISNEASRRIVHRERGRVDAILTGIGTVLADDPLLTPRGTGVRLRRAQVRQKGGGLPLRVVVDPRLQTPVESKLAQTAREVPTLIACDEAHSGTDAASRLQALGATLAAFPLAADGELPLASLLKELVAKHDVTHVLVEAGVGLMTRLFRQRLANEAWVFTAPIAAGDHPTLPNVRGICDSVRMTLWSRRRRGGDVIERYCVHDIESTG